MCALCEKISTVKDIMMGYFTDEELIKMSEEIGLKGWDVRGTRLSVFIMAIVELCIENHLTGHDIHDGIEVAVMRDHMRRVMESHYPDRKHSIKERLEGYDS